VLVDRNGYLPTHNLRYSQPLTGNLANDLVNNRTKRIFNDKTGLAAARNQAPFLIQRYQRDTGETMVDLSVPVMVKGAHWGALRIGYRQVENR
jgi:methyl-accepting chemotaxis protein